MSGAPPAGTYPGNLSLPVEVREKILSTFRHTLDLYRDGKVDDCLIGRASCRERVSSVV